MMDYLIAVGVAVAGILVVFVIFSSISSADVTVVEDRSRASGASKKSRKSSKRRKDDALDEETEALLMQELARAPQGMAKDTDTMEPQTLEQMRHRRQAEVEAKRAQYTAAEATERQRLIDRELGFRQVEKVAKAAKEEKQPKEEEAPVQGTNDVVERMLHVFFSSSNEGRRFHSSSADGAGAKGGNAAPSGGRVSVKGEIGTRTWATNEN
ncbi:hypothetical protein STCU_00031 [Strigomonas culicis]|uniref:Uncharacterized protein n=1 Tax=Strigomonas culicis TaxID=28005 RepID=S9WDQ3_9TRYP|nr:hypothetical protein STCU_00031 [Strigomonas culicis]|eukprot:EPY37266.1 hypothetical protein STCU_00031 [Strigomonas culicis]